jgi:two-component system, cell cycle sensor histidine kinase and response regulator CckA
MTVPLRILMVEDSPEDAELTLRELRRGGFDPASLCVQTRGSLAAALEDRTWDIVLSDYTLPGFSGTEALAMVRSRNIDVPFIFISGTISEEDAVAAMRAGAQDYFSKEKLKRLVPAIERELREAATRRQRMELEERLRRSQRMEAIGQLTGGLAHDFNNLLTVVIGSLDLLRDHLEALPQAQAAADTAIKAALRGADLTHKLLAFARRQSLEVQKFDLNDLVLATTELLRRTLGEQIRIELDLPPTLWCAYGDPTQTESALTNLAVNARDAMPDGGRLLISTGNARLDAAEAARHLDAAPGDFVSLCVADTGTGIPPDVLAHVFEPFFTTKERGKGTGLGLSMVFGFAKQSGGHVRIETEIGRGTTVRLYLPALVGAILPAGNDPAAETPDAARRARVLLVEDNADLRQLAATLLRDLGHDVVEAGSGPAGIEILAGEEGIDILFTDVVLPGGMTGLELARKARGLRPDLKVVLTSGFAENSLSDLSDLGPLLRKPYRKLELARRLAEVMAAPAGAPQVPMK